MLHFRIWGGTRAWQFVELANRMKCFPLDRNSTKLNRPCPETTQFQTAGFVFGPDAVGG